MYLTKPRPKHHNSNMRTGERRKWAEVLELVTSSPLRLLGTLDSLVLAA